MGMVGSLVRMLVYRRLLWLLSVSTTYVEEMKQYGSAPWWAQTQEAWVEEMKSYDPAPWWAQTQERSDWLYKLESQKPWKFSRNGSLAVFRPDDLDHGTTTAEVNNHQVAIEGKQTICLDEAVFQCTTGSAPLKFDEAGSLESEPSSPLEWLSAEHGSGTSDDKIAEQETVLTSASGSLIIPTRTCVGDGPGHVIFPQRNLCALCRQGFEGTITCTDVEHELQTSPLYHHLDCDSLNASALEGCPLCQLFAMDDLTPIKEDSKPFKRHEMMFWYPRPFQYAIRDRMLIGDLQYAADPSQSRFYELSALQDGESRFCRRKISALPDLELGRQWIQTCIRDHNCDQGRTSELPTRLIDVGVSIRQGKLVDTSTIGEKQDCQYAALSHCWGSRHPNSRTTKDNVHTRTKTLDFDSLEQTFKDAITVTRALGYKYLWIDTLCIIQDDEGDWKKECSRMDTVFSNAVVTVAALDAPDAFAGFLRPRELLKVCEAACRVSLNGPHGLVENILVSRRGRFDYSGNRLRQWSSLLGGRAWCLQEQLLSVRTLNFSKFQMVFECWLCERGDTPLPWQFAPMGLRTGLNLLKDHYIHPFHTMAPSTAKADNYSGFYATVENYSQRSLSFEKDRLPGLSGLVKCYFQFHQDDYLAGIWRRDLLERLFWRAAHQDDEYAAPPEYVAPSWSWASVNRWVSWPAFSGNLKPEAEIVRASTTTLGNDPFGQVSAGEIYMKAWIHESQLHCKATLWGTYFFLRQRPQDRSIAIVSFDRNADEPNSSQQLLFTCILLGSDNRACFGLALRLVDSTSATATYRRIGTVESKDGFDTRTEFEDMIKEGEFKEIRLI